MKRQDLSQIFPTIDLPVSIYVLFYGDHTALCARFMASLFRLTPPQSFELTIGLNAVCDDTRRLTQEAAKQNRNVTIIESEENAYKYPMMRRMFASTPPHTWTIWFDDDSYLTRPDWLQTLALRIESSPKTALYGKIYFIDFPESKAEEIRRMPWYNGVPFPPPRLSKSDAFSISFPTGGFWAVKSDVLRQLNWPDQSLIHNGGDFLLAEAVRQQGLAQESFEYGVAINQAPRRS